VATRPTTPNELAIRKTPEARKMIREERLEKIVAVAEEVARQFARDGLPINYLAVTREVDPEIDGWIKLSITVWVANDAVDAAVAARRPLWQETHQRVTTLGRDEERKFSQLVSIGIDIDDE
jgi:hypothetical protein